LTAEWNERFATGVAVVDDQHKGLFVEVGGLLEALTRGEGEDRVAFLLDKLIADTVEHFRTEEDFMQKHGFTGRAAHLLEHRLLLEELGSFRRQWALRARTLNLAEVVRFLEDWFTHHIQQMDGQYAAFMRTRRLP